MKRFIFIALAILLSASSVHAYRGIAMVKYQNGIPNFSGLPDGTNVSSVCTGTQYNGWDMCLVSMPDKASVDAILALPNTQVLPVCYFRNLDQVMALTVRTKINTYLASISAPLIPADWTNKQFVRAYLKRIANVEDERVIVIGDAAEDAELNPTP